MEKWELFHEIKYIKCVTAFYRGSVVLHSQYLSA